MIESYTILSAYSIDGFKEATDELLKEVNDLITFNFQPFGSLTLVRENEWYAAYQPMVMVKEPPRMVLNNQEYERKIR